MTPVVELQQVSSGVLRALDVRAYPGERVGVIAEAGSGKSVLAELLVGVRLPRRGRVRRDGRDVTRRARTLEPATAAPGVGWVAQPSRPFRSLSVYENVLVAASVRGRSHRLAEGHARRALERLGLEAQADRLPAALAAIEAVRLDVARVVAAPRRLIVVDQLADRVDDPTRALMIDVLDESVAAGAALVWLERPDQPPRAVDRLLVLAYGRVAQEGPPEQVLATPHFRRPPTAGRGAPSEGSGREATGGWAASSPSPPSSPADATSPSPSPSPSASASASESASQGDGAGAADGAPYANGAQEHGAAPPEAAPRSAAGGPQPPGGNRRRHSGRRGGGRGRGAAEGLPALALDHWTVHPTGAVPSGVADLGLEVALGEVVAVVSPDSAPTSRLLASLAGLVDAEGALWVSGRDLTGASAAARARAGLAFVPQDGGVADGLTVDEHLSLAGVRRWRRRWTKGAIFGLFPSLAAARQRPAGGLPSLERRCLGLARALVTDPTVVLVDEPVRGVALRSAPVVLQALAVAARTAAVVLAERPDGPGLTVADRIEPLDTTRPLAPQAPAGAAR